MTTWIESTPDAYLTEKTPTTITATTSPDLQLTGERLQKLRGFGGCFNELGYLPLSKLPDDQQQMIYRDLFSPEGLNFTFNRTQLGRMISQKLGTVMMKAMGIMHWMIFQ
ncbi:hypothetical protein [Levilactobacillus brevis]|uniref:hypothetical protein n=1 Tax=Levilactobacillus brevis TaxID=1580 RepID=UPI001CDB6A0F|nr:hypothetical protein [Levilactobacillus brevis]